MEVQKGETCDVIRLQRMLRCNIHSSENYGSDPESLLDFDDLLVSSFHPDIPDEEVGLEQEHAGSLRLGPYHSELFFVEC